MYVYVVIIIMIRLFCFVQSIQLQMASPSGNTVPPNGSGSVTQVINIANPQKVCRLCQSYIAIRKYYGYNYACKLSKPSGMHINLCALKHDTYMRP